MVSDALSPESKKLPAEPQLPSFQGPDDRWVCIPHGIVEHYKSRFENPGTTDEDAEAPTGALAADGNAASASGDLSGVSAVDAGREDDAEELDGIAAEGLDGIFEVHEGLPLQRRPSTEIVDDFNIDEEEEEQA